MSCQSSFTNLNSAQRGVCFLAVLLVSGCASETPNFLITPKAETHYYPNSKAYNRPYTVKGKTYYPLTSAQGYREIGVASWYGPESGNRTAMGTPFKPFEFSAAHKTLPLPTRVRVTNLENGRSIDLWVNDRGPFRKNRLIDLSQGAAKAIGMRGTTKVKVEHLEMRADND